VLRSIGQSRAHTAANPCFAGVWKLVKIHVEVRVRTMADVAACSTEIPEILAGSDITLGESLRESGDHDGLILVRTVVSGCSDSE
jgi:hypothetical protein